MNIAFEKYHGAGNDFVIIDNRSLFFDKKDTGLIAMICNRRIGIGADGLILLESDEQTDFKMVYYNADGNESTMCGNGGRCLVAYAKSLGIIKDNTLFIAIDGLHKATIDSNNNVNLQMKDVNDIESFNDDFVLDTGSPHYVKIVKEYTADFVNKAKSIRNSDRFIKEGINVNFIKVDNNNLEIRTFERGVEDETLACGTGCVAAALSVMKTNKNINSVNLKTVGGLLKVSATRVKEGFNNVWLFGPTAIVFKGKYQTK
jgi:diaminopimelate epimerase